MDSPQALIPGVAAIPVLVGLIWYLVPRIRDWWLRTHRPPPTPPRSPPRETGTPVTGTRVRYRLDEEGGSPSPPSSPWLQPPPPQVLQAPVCVGSLDAPLSTRRLSLRSATLNPSR